jgi:hypothetical protein
MIKISIGSADEMKEIKAPRRLAFRETAFSLLSRLLESRNRTRTEISDEKNSRNTRSVSH